MIVLAIDPGPNTGYCHYNPKTKVGSKILVWQVELPQRERHLALWNELETLQFDVLICERFEFRKDDQNRDKIDYTAAELFGVCCLWAQQNKHVNFVKQGSAQVGRTAFWSDDNAKVKKIGLYNPRCAPHGMDALRHFLYYDTFVRGCNEWLEMLK